MTKEGRQKLAIQVAYVHADIVNHYIQQLNCSSEQKICLLDAIISTVKKAAD